MKKNQVFSRLLSIYFYVGVNVIGIPELHKCEFILYKNQTKHNYNTK